MATGQTLLEMAAVALAREASPQLLRCASLGGAATVEPRPRPGLQLQPQPQLRKPQTRPRSSGLLQRG